MPWYRGDLHVHTARSNGADLSPAQVVAAARDAGLDFIATTEHNTVDGHGDWAGLAGDLLVIPGQEVVTPTGHWLAVGGPPGRLVDRQDGVIGPELERVRRDGGLCIAAHPHAPYASGRMAHPLALFDAVEVWNGAWSSDLPWQADNAAALAEWSHGLAAGVAAGCWLPAVGNSDAHLAGQLGTPQTVVRADSCTPAALLAGVRAGRSRIVGSAAVTLSVRVSAGPAVAGPGDVLTADGPVSVHVAVTGVAAGEIALHTGRGAVHRAPSDGAVRVDLPEPGFVWVSVRAESGSLAAMANPVIVG